MSKLAKSILVALTAIVGLCTIVLAVMYFLGFDSPCPCNDCKCKDDSFGSRRDTSTTKVKRHYTKLVLPRD